MGAFNNSLFGGGAPASAAISVSASKLIYGALRLLGVLRPGQAASGDSMADGLDALNQLLDAWNAEPLLIPYVQRDLYDLVSGRQDYGLGIGADFDAPRPAKIYAAAIVDAQGGETPIRVVEQPHIAGPRLYTDRAFPVTNVNLDPAPSDGQQLALYTWRALDSFADLTTEYSFPPGYAAALRFSLAAQLAPAFVVLMKIAQPLLESIESKAREYKAAIQSLNAVTPEMACDGAVLTPWYFDVWRGL